MFVLRTGTKLFKTIRRATLAGTVSFDSVGGADCTPLPVSSCNSSRTLSVSHRFSSTSEAALLMSPDEHGWTTLSFADRAAASTAGHTWYHVMYALGANPLSGQLPTLGAALPSSLPIQGSGTFTAQRTATETQGGCRATTATGTFQGTFRARFAGWGMRTMRASPTDFARYVEYG